MPWTVLQIAAKARSLPEVTILARIALGLAGGFLLFRVASNLLDPAELATLDYFGLVVFTAVGLSLLRAALRRLE